MANPKNPPYDLPGGGPAIVKAPVIKVIHKKKPVLHSKEGFRPAHVEAVSDINITPLIDVMLVLLIIFMVVTPLAQKGLDIALPQTNTEPPPPNVQDNTIVLQLDESGMSVNKSPVASMEELDTRLKDIFQTRTDKTIFVKASGTVLYGKVVDAMDLAKAAGVERIGIISEKMIQDAGGVVDAPPVPPAP